MGEDDGAVVSGSPLAAAVQLLTTIDELEMKLHQHKVAVARLQMQVEDITQNGGDIASALEAYSAQVDGVQLARLGLITAYSDLFVGPVNRMNAPMDLSTVPDGTEATVEFEGKFYAGVFENGGFRVTDPDFPMGGAGVLLQADQQPVPFVPETAASSSTPPTNEEPQLAGSSPDTEAAPASSEFETPMPPADSASAPLTEGDQPVGAA